MKLSSGKRIGQSRQELATAVSFSFFLQLSSFCAVLLYYRRAQEVRSAVLFRKTRQPVGASSSTGSRVAACTREANGQARAGTET
jgi:hypothetical protein